MKPGIDVSVREVGLRDGIQNISAFMPTAAKLEWLAAEARAGMSEIEVCSFVPPKVIPQFADATEAGMIGRELAASPAAGGVRLTGFFGVFYAGRLVARVYDARGVALKTIDVTKADPLEAVALDAVIPAPPEAATISLHLVDERGLDRGSLGQVEVVKSN